MEITDLIASHPPQVPNPHLTFPIISILEERRRPEGTGVEEPEEAGGRPGVRGDEEEDLRRDL